MSVLMIVEHDNKRMHPSTQNLLSAALQLSGEVIALVVGHNSQAIVQDVASLSGIKKVWHVEDEIYAHPIAENLSKLVAALGQDAQYIIASASTFGKNLLPRVAAMFDVAQISDMTKIIDATTFEHPIYAGNALETVQSLDEKIVITVRPTAFEAVTERQNTCNIENFKEISVSQGTQFIKHELSHSQRPDLGNASIVVSGGRGLQSAEKFSLLEELADTLGAAIGASRAAVDAGFVSNEFQVGQTGRIVAPTLYFAIGISGAVQHLAGMKDSKVIVAINKDPDAPIFQIATYGLVGDLFEILPQLAEQFKKK
jgi:electron transfer flavoprotein alpha subunit